MAALFGAREEELEDPGAGDGIADGVHALARRFYPALDGVSRTLDGAQYLDHVHQGDAAEDHEDDRGDRGDEEENIGVH